MINSKKTTLLTLCLTAIILNANVAWAGFPKVAPATTAGVSLEGVSTIVDKAAEKLRSLEKTVNEKVLGPGLKEFNSLKSKVDKAKSDVDGKISGVKNDIDGKVSGIKNDVGGKINPIVDGAKGKVESVTGDVEGKVSDLGISSKADGFVGDVAKKFGGAVDPALTKELASLQIEKTQIEAQYDVQLKAKAVYYDGIINGLESNISNIRERSNVEGIAGDIKLGHEDTIKTISKEIASLSSDKLSDELALQKEKATKVKVVDDKISALKSQITSSMKDKAEKEAKAKGDKYFGKSDTKKALDKTKEEMFLKEGEPQTSAKVEALREFRRADAVKHVFEVFSLSLQTREFVDKNNETVEEMAMNQGVLEGENGSIMVGTELTVEQTKALLKKIEVSLAQMKLKSSNSLARIDMYTFTDNKRDITKFNLDDYSFDKNCKNTAGPGGKI